MWLESGAEIRAIAQNAHATLKIRDKIIFSYADFGFLVPRPHREHKIDFRRIFEQKIDMTKMSY